MVQEEADQTLDCGSTSPEKAQRERGDMWGCRSRRGRPRWRDWCGRPIPRNGTGCQKDTGDVQKGQRLDNNSTASTLDWTELTEEATGPVPVPHRTRISTVP